MMASNYHLSLVLNFLRTKHIVISSQNEWLLGCYEYYSSENSSDHDVQALKSFVFEQWLLADLRDVGEACLPHNIGTLDKIMLNNTYALQVDEMINVAESFYSQLQKLKQQMTDNLEVTETEKPAAWEPKSKRMLKLTCTDGVNTVYGMEYESIRALHEPFIPGCKILVTGPVECRQGVMLLTSRNLIVLGGEVDSLIIKNSPINILSSKLNMNAGETEIVNSTPVVTDREDFHSTNVSSASRMNENIQKIGSRTNSAEPITFTQGDDKDFDDDEIFLSDQINEVEKSLNARFQNHSENMSRGDDSAAEVSFSPHSFPAQEKQPLNAVFSNNIGASSASPSSSVSHTIEPSRSSNVYCSVQPTKRTNNDISLCDFSSLCSETTIRDLRALHECNAMRPELTYKCKARVTKLRSKPQIKNEKWLMSVEIGDDNASLEVAFHSSFLDSLFGYSAVEVFSQRERMKSNAGVKEKVDQGNFFVKCVSNSDLPTVMRVGRDNEW